MTAPGAIRTGKVIDPPPGVVATVTGNRAFVTLVAYCMVCAAAAAWTLRRRDVT